MDPCMYSGCNTTRYLPDAHTLIGHSDAVLCAVFKGWLLGEIMFDKEAEPCTVMHGVSVVAPLK
jgi:hypothetical protein